MEERRQSPRLSIKAGVKFRLFDPVNKTAITNAVDAQTKNMSQNGICLRLPRSWDCPECNNCLGWFYNARCHLRNGNNGNGHHTPPAELHLKLLIPREVLHTPHPIEIEGKCVWISEHIDKKEDMHDAGICFALSDTSQDKRPLDIYQHALSHF